MRRSDHTHTMTEPLKNAFLFSGQGSQYFQMGAGLFDAHPGFQARMREMDDVAVELLGFSVLSRIYDPSRKKSDAFDETATAGIAIFMVEHALVQVLEEAGITPDLVIGTSLGMFAAGCSAGCLRMRQAMEMIVRQSQILEQHCPRGCMSAVFANPALFKQKPQLRDHVDLAGVNFDSHFAISAPEEKLIAAEEFLQRENIGFSRLAVTLPFHSRWMDGARTEMLEEFERHAYRPAERQLVCCATAGPLAALSAQALWHVVRQPIGFQRTIAALEAAGPLRYIDAGPSGTLATFLKYALPKATRSQAHPIVTPFGNDRSRLDALVARMM